jgi:hypothetical protein
MKIVTLILRHELTILIAYAPCKGRNASIAQHRSLAHEIEQNAECFESKSASAIAWSAEILREARKAPSGLNRMSLSASRGASKNQCADKGFSIADKRRVRERQFALSCLSSSLVSRVHNPILKHTWSFSGMRGNAICGHSGRSFAQL